MHGEKITSLRRYKAHKHYKQYIMLPSAMRTPDRAEGVLTAIFDYAYEHVDCCDGHPLREASWEETRNVSKKLVEFMPVNGGSDPDEMMQWLHENLVPEAWMSPDYLKDFLHECLRHG